MNKENWPEFPFWWLEKGKRNMSGLPVIAWHLHEKTAGFQHHDSGVRGETSEVEKQIVEHISVLRQQVSILSDVAQALLRIIAKNHERRISQKAKRMLRWTWEKAKEYEQKALGEDDLQDSRSHRNCGNAMAYLYLGDSFSAPS